MLLRWWRWCMLGALLCLQLSALGQTPEPEPDLWGSDKSWLGTNLPGIADWSNDYPFVDVFKTSRPWISGSETAWDDGRELDLDEHGWVKSLQPGQWARTLFFWGSNGEWPKGDYLLLYDGEGTLDFQYVSTDPTKSEPGQEVVLAQNSFVLNITSTNPDNYIRNIRLIMPGYWDTYQEQVYYSAWLGTLEKYGTLRFMDWQNTNYSPLVTWEQRPRPDDCRYAGDRGAPLEVMVDICNRARCDAWFNIPYRADDNFIRQFAIIVRDQLDPRLKVYFEYSNEDWNWLFPVNQYERDQGQADGIEGLNQYYVGWKWYSRRTVQMFDILEEVFGAGAMGSRVIRVMGTQPWPDQLRTKLDFENAALKTDAAAAANYFGGDITNTTPHHTVGRDVLLRRLSTVSIPKTTAWMRSLRAVALERGIPSLLAYEGGQHLRIDGASARVNTIMTEANRDPVMEKLYLDLFTKWRDLGGGVFCHYVNVSTFGSGGRWGAQEYTGQSAEAAPKWRAILAVIDDGAVK